MKQSEVTAAFNAGKIITVATFLHFKKETVAYRDDKGKPATFDKLEFACLAASGVVFVQPDTRKIPGFDIHTFKCPFVPNDKVVVEIDKLEVVRGVTSIGGTVSKLE